MVPIIAQPTVVELMFMKPAPTTAAEIAANLDGLRAMLPPAFDGPRGKLQTASDFIRAQAERIVALETLVAEKSQT